MIKHLSLTRIKYQATYRQLRINGGTPPTENPFAYFDDAQDCAILSYDYHDSTFSGWINRQRHQQFLMIWEAKVFREDFFR